LKIEKQLLDDHQMQLTVEVEADRMEASKRRAAKQIAKRGKIPGFRPGKAPYHVMSDSTVKPPLWNRLWIC
jgi:trigger factor